jgi:quercetin dioxygenase-like cupin family protein
MRVIRAADRIGGDSRPPKGRFHGHALQNLLHETTEETRISFVRFEPGAHTQWHRHAGGQVIHIVEGSATVAAWGEATESLSAGDTVIAPRGEKHWHGASGDGPLNQIAVTSGEVTRLEDAGTQ